MPSSAPSCASLRVPRPVRGAGSFGYRASLAEWDEPNDDWVYDRWNKWGQAAKDLFNAQWQDKGLGTQLRIADELYYNYTGVDGEINEPNKIVVGNNYFIDYKVNSEKKAIVGSPTFNSDLEWCNNFFLGCDPIDRTGMMRKVALVQ